jgi:hypothetical protein
MEVGRDLLNPAQANALLITLRIFEERLRQAELWLLGAEEKGILYQRKLHLSAQRKLTARRLIESALEEIEEVSRKFDFPRSHDDPAGLIRAQMNLSWADLCDVFSKKLRAYGTVDPQLTLALDPHLEELAKLALSIASEVRDGS